MSVIRIAFLGTPDFAKYHLQALLDDEHYQVVGVVTQPDRPSGRNMKLSKSPVKELAEERGLKVIAPESIKHDDVIQEIASWRAEAAVVVAYGQIVPQKFLDLYPSRVVNVHGSLLPKWRGAAPIQRAVEAGDKISGVSLQVMVKKLDAGDVIGSYSLPIDENWSALDLLEQMKPLGARLLHVEFMDYLRGNLTAKPQDESQVTYAHKIDKAEAKINWREKTAEQVRDHIRAMKMGPGSVTALNGRNLKIIEAEVVGKSSGVPGEVVDVGSDNIAVICAGNTRLKVTRVQPESKPQMAVKDFLLGNKINRGDILQ